MLYTFIIQKRSIFNNKAYTIINALIYLTPYLFIYRDLNSKRTSYIDWDEYFMAIAFLSAKRSKDPCTQVGACIVNNDKRIVGIGYNGMPMGCDDDKFPWGKGSRKRDLDGKYLYGAIYDKHKIFYTKLYIFIQK